MQSSLETRWIEYHFTTLSRSISTCQPDIIDIEILFATKPRQL